MMGRRTGRSLCSQIRRHKEAVDAARKKAGEAHFGIEWERPASGRFILISRTRATALESHESAVDWFMKRLHELADSRVLELLVSGQDPAQPLAG